MFGKYYRLTKPGIIRGNILVAAAAILFASDGDIDVVGLIATLVGTSLIIASACIYNNYLDREIDKKMARTEKRALVTGEVSVRSALSLGAVLLVLGSITLAVWVNLLTLCIGLFGWIMYVTVYGYFKRKTVYGTLVGSISGAMPPVAGYSAVTGQIDATSGLLFLMLACWQMPHFYAIAIYRIKDYRAAKIPVLPLVSGVRQAKIQILAYIAVYTAVCIAFTLLGYASWAFAVGNGIYGLAWVYIGLSNFNKLSDIKWARKMFFVSLAGLPVLSLMLALNPYLN